MGPTFSHCESFDSDLIRGIQRYEEAARHILDALTLQNSDAVGDPRGGVTSDALWNCLESVCGKMGRLDLIGACDRRDLDGEYLRVDSRARPVADQACSTGLSARFETDTSSG
jgi:hypothetical protein